MHESESGLVRVLSERSTIVSTALVRTELRRAVAGASLREAGQVVEALLDSINLLELDAATLDRAGALQPAALRSLDAVHLASALSVADRIQGLVTYDVRLAAAARDHGLTVLAPGVDP